MFEKNTGESASPMKDVSHLPDVSHPESSLDWGASLPWVGMREIEMPIRLLTQKGEMLLASRLDIGVSLDRKEARGIHMSRLYRLASEHLPKVPLSWKSLADLALQGLSTHAGLSTVLNLKLRFSLPLERAALKSGGHGWRNYPVQLVVRQTPQGTEAELEVEVLYSSTCPASAALSRQVNQQAGLSHFQKEIITRAELSDWLASSQSLAATPHAQRSRALVRAQVSLEEAIDLYGQIVNLVDLVEEALGTPVQTLVKREDEQEFARRNAEHLMFCEDAARQLNDALEASCQFPKWSGEVSHFESLHPHDAVALFAGQKTTDN